MRLVLVLSASLACRATAVAQTLAEGTRWTTLSDSAGLHVTRSEWRDLAARSGLRHEGDRLVDKKGRPLTQEALLRELLRTTSAALKALRKKDAGGRGELGPEDIALAKHILRYRLALFQDEAKRERLYRFLEKLIASRQRRPRPPVLDERQPEQLLERAEREAFPRASADDDASVSAAPTQPETAAAPDASPGLGRSQSEHFLVTVEGASDPERARTLAGLIAAQAEEQFQAISRRWLGRALYLGPDPVPIRVTLQEGARSGDLSQGAIVLAGSQAEVLASLLPHELTHLVLRAYFGGELPRAFEEGAAADAESPERKAADQADMRNFLSQGESFDLYELFSLKDYPEAQRDRRLFYAQGASVTEFLVEARGGGDEAHRALAGFLAEALRPDPEGTAPSLYARWDGAVRKYYGFDDVSRLASAWAAWAAAAPTPARLPEGAAVEKAWDQAPPSRFEKKPPQSEEEGGDEASTPAEPPKEDDGSADDGGGGGGFSCAAADPAKDADGADFSRARRAGDGSPLLLLAVLLLPALRDLRRARR